MYEKKKQNKNKAKWIFLGSYENAKKHCISYGANALDVRDAGNNNREDCFGLDDEDIERIQEILDQSDEESNNDDVQILFDGENDFPMPIKPAQNWIKISQNNVCLVFCQ